MKLISFLFGCTLVAVIEGQGTDCDFDYVCDASTSPEDLVMTTGPSPAACYEACKASTDGAGAPNCEFWTYYETLGFKTFDGENGTELDSVDGKMKAVGEPVCSRLLDCETQFDKSDCGNIGNNCASGPKSCQPCDKCLTLNYAVGATKSHWTCETDSPYRKENMPPGTMCWAECPSTAVPGKWTETTGGADATIAEATCTSVCDTLPDAANADWKLTIEVTDGDANVLSPILDSNCPCQDIILEAHQVPQANGNGATSEEGARFRCKDPLGDSGIGNGLDTMDSTSRCQLFCNNHLAMDIRCVAGSWTDNVKSNADIYCWGPPLACDYNPGVNMDVCVCMDDPSNPSVTDNCAADQGCLAGVCLNVCEQKDAAVVGDSCFCETKTGGVSCADGSTCNNWECV